MRQYIGAVRAKNNILTPLCLFIQTSPNNKPVASGNGNRLFTDKWHVQIANNPRYNARPRLNYYFLPDPSHFSLPSTFKRSSQYQAHHHNFVSSLYKFGLFLQSFIRGNTS
jgi:hypothetical protein